MKAKKNWIITIVLLAIFLAAVQVTQVAGKAEQKNTKKFVTEQREILAGLQGVYVCVEGFKPEAEKYGFNKQQYQTDVELRFRQYGVKVLSFEESRKTAGSPHLYINVHPVISEKSSMAAVTIEITFKEIVVLRRNPTIRTIATTWDSFKTVICGLSKLDEVRKDVRDSVDIFINDYLAANPKEQTPQQKTEK